MVNTMMNNHNNEQTSTICTLSHSDHPNIELVQLQPEEPLKDYLQAMELAKNEATHHLEDSMLMSWYDRDRDFESPQHSTESDEDCAIPGYVEYGTSHGATLKIDIEKGRFVFFFTPIEW